ncbi:MAG: hypothetical protein N2C14_00520, partial [Planctomycetales bacterium]
YYATTGQVPFPGGKSTDKARAHVSEIPQDCREVNPAISEEFARIIRRMMDKQPEQRPGSAEELIGLLSPWVPENSPAYSAVGNAGTSTERHGSRVEVRSPPEPGQTESSFLVEPGSGAGEGSSSKWWQRTTKMSSPGEETVPEYADDDAPIPAILQALILLGGVSSLLVLAAVIATMLLNA